MPGSSLVKKLLLKPDYRYLLINAPEGYLAQLGHLPPGVQLAEKPGGVFDLVQIFVKSKAELGGLAETALQSVKPNGLLWVSYLKKTSKIKTDISRDYGWESLQEAGWGGVAMVAISGSFGSIKV